MNRQLEELEKECVNYEKILKDLKEKRQSSSFDKEIAQRKINDLEVNVIIRIFHFIQFSITLKPP